MKKGIKYDCQNCVWHITVRCGHTLVKKSDPISDTYPDLTWPGSSRSVRIQIHKLRRWLQCRKWSFPKKKTTRLWILLPLDAVLWIRIRIWIGPGFNGVSRFVSGFTIRIRIQEGKNDLQTIFEVLNFLFWGLKAFPVVGTQENAIFFFQKKKKLSTVFFSSVLLIKTMDPY